MSKTKKELEEEIEELEDTIRVTSVVKELTAFGLITIGMLIIVSLGFSIFQALFGEIIGMTLTLAILIIFIVCMWEKVIE